MGRAEKLKKIMNLDGIDIFVKVVQAGSFTSAAKQLNMPITTVSGKVAALEKRLGITLLHRTTRKLNLTDSGEVFFKHCEKALDEIKAGESELSQSKSEIEGVLKITASLDVSQTLLPPILRDYLKRYPKVKIELIVTNRQVDLISEGIDLALRVGKLKDSTLMAKKFMEAQACLWASPTYIKKHGSPQHPKQLAEHTFIEFSRTPKKIRLTKNQSVVEVETSGQIIVDDMSTLKSFVLAGDGIGTIPNFICESEEKNGQLVRILPSWTWGSFNLSFVYPPQRFVSAKVRSFIEFATQK